jgi:hypothetical protein
MDEKEPVQISNQVKVKPTGIPFRCVICNGFGTLKYGEKKCQGCEGKGYILVPTEEVK